MAVDLNTFAATGRLTKDAETKEVSGKTLVTCDVAVNSGFGSNAKCLYVKLNLWEKAGTGVFPYLKKGQLIGMTGRLDRNDWITKDGQNRTDIIINGSCNLLGSKKESNDSPEHPADEVIY